MADNALTRMSLAGQLGVSLFLALIIGGVFWWQYLSPAMEEEKQKTQARLQHLQKQQPGSKSQILSAEQQAELERFKKTYIETNLALKELRRNLRQDAEALVFWTKLANIAVMPLLVALAGLLVALLRRRTA